MGRRGNDSVILTAATLGAISGLRSMAAPALLAHEFAEGGDADEFGVFERVLTSEHTARLLAMFAGGEMVADKTAYIPNRTEPLPLIGRAVIGSLTAAAFAVRRQHTVLVPAAVGAASAIASTFAAFHVRRFVKERFHVPDRVLGLAEDALVMAASKTVMDVTEV